MAWTSDDLRKRMAQIIAPPATLTLDFSKDIAAMPGEDGIPGQDDVAPYCLVIDKSAYFDVVSYLYKDALAVRHFTNGDVPRPETDFVAWALLPDFNC